MEVTKGVTVNYLNGKIVLEAHVAEFAIPVLADLEAKINSGEIDPIKGTDIDKMLLLQGITFLRSVLTK